MVSHNDTIDVVRRALAGHSKADERTLASATVLAERLERVKRLSGLFEQVEFSPHMQALLTTRQTVGTAGYAAV